MTWFWLGLFIAAQLADLVTTAASLRFGGVEANPLVSGLISGGGLDGYASVRLLAIAAGVGLIFLASWLRRWLPDRLASRVSRSLVAGLQLGVAVQLFAVLANLMALGGDIRV
jgi:hypothetical protein